MGPLNHPRWRPVVLPAAALLLLVGCSLGGSADRPGGVTIHNDLDETVQLVYQGRPRGDIEADRDAILQLDPTGSSSGTDCTSDDIVVFALDGKERVRIPPPACLDETITLSEWMSH